MSEQKTPAVYAAWAGVCEDMARGGIGKNNKASMGAGGNYMFRGIDDVLLALSASMTARKLGVGIVFGDPVVTLRDKGNGKSERHIVCCGAFTLVSQADGSREGPFRFVGEAADSGDKASNKAMSIAYKYFAIQTFAIPTHGVLADETPNEPDEPVRGPAPQPARNEAPKAETVIAFGPAKGKAFDVASDDELNWYANEAVKVLNDRTQSQHHARAQRVVDAIEAEFVQRTGRGR
jgi:hypothetical protein